MTLLTNWGPKVGPLLLLAPNRSEFMSPSTLSAVCFGSTALAASRPEVLSQAFLGCRARFFSRGDPRLLRGIQIGGFVVRGFGLPAAVEYADPFERQGAHGRLVCTALRALLVVVSPGPGRFVDGLSGPLDDGLA